MIRTTPPSDRSRDNRPSNTPGPVQFVVPVGPGAHRDLRFEQPAGFGQRPAAADLQLGSVRREAPVDGGRRHRRELRIDLVGGDLPTYHQRELHPPGWRGHLQMNQRLGLRGHPALSQRGTLRRSAGTTTIASVGSTRTLTVRRLRAVLAASAMICIAGIAVPDPLGAALDPNAGWFVSGPRMQGSGFFDVGVTDIDADGFLDIFAPGHSFTAGLWRNNGALKFTANRIDDYGLGQDPEFPEWESGVTPTIAGDGVYVYRSTGAGPSDTKPTMLNLVWRSSATAPLEVSITFYAPTTVLSENGASVDVVERTDGSGRQVWLVAGTVNPGGSITMQPAAPGLPIDVQIDAAAYPADINVGPLLVHPKSNSFTLNAKDRHGVAFADYMGDSNQDALWAVGGMKDHAGLFIGLIDDQVFVNKNGIYRELGSSSDVTKTTCRGYEARVVDANADGVLDVYVGCWGQRPQLWYQDAPGHFRLDPLANVTPTVYGSRWLDLDNDGVPELVSTTGKQVVVYSRDAEGTYLPSGAVNIGDSAGQSQNLQAADYDGDGFQDLLVTSTSASALLRNTAGTLTRTGLAAIGLPFKMAGAAWADIDSDGLMDVLAMPHGLYIQGPGGTFATSGVLGNLAPTSFASVSFADLDNNGTRDVVANIDGALSYTAKNIAAHGNWLQVDLVGPPGNANAIGAYVTTRAGTEVQRHWVGESETSVFSQGHHRLYFGLGSLVSIDTLEVTWANGTATVLTDVATNRLIRVVAPGS